MNIDTHRFHPVAVVMLTCSIVFGCCPETPDDPAFEEKLDQRLRALVAGMSSMDEPDAIKAATFAGLALDGEMVLLEITTRQEQDIAGLREFVEQSGGHVLTTFQNVIYGALPADSVGVLAKNRGVWSIRASAQVMRPFKPDKLPGSETK